MAAGSGQWRVVPDGARRRAAAVLSDALTWEELIQRCGAPDAPDPGVRPRVPAQGLAAALPQPLPQAFPQALIDSLSAETPAGAALLRQLAHTGLAEAQLQEGCEALPEAFQKRGSSVARRYEAFNRLRLEVEGTSQEPLQRAIDRLEAQGLPEPLQAATGLWLFLDRPLSALETGFLLALAQACEARQVRLQLELASTGVAAADQALESLYGTLEQKAQTLNFVELERGAGPAGEGPWMELAAETLAETAQPREAPTPLELVCARSVAEEADEVARRVEQLIAQGVAPGDIGVALFDEGAEEARRMEAALVRRGLPVHAETMRLSATPAARRALELLTVRDHGHPVARVAPLLTSPAGAPSPIVLLSEAGVRDAAWGAADGKDGYEIRLDALEQRLEGRGRRERAGAVAALRSQWRALRTDLEALPNEGPLGELWGRSLALFRRWASRAGEAAGLQESLESATSSLSASPLWNRRVTRAQLVRALSWCWDRTPVKPGGEGVWLVRARGLAGRVFRHLFVVGLESDRFPRPWSAPSPLPEEAQRELNRWARRPLFSLQSAETLDRLSWAQCLGTARESLTLSFAQTGWNGERKEPSDWVRRLAQATERTLPQPLPRFALERAGAEAELQLAAARLLASPDAPAVEAVLGGEPWLHEARARAAMEMERLRAFSQPEAAAGPFSGQVHPDAALETALAYGPEHPVSASRLGRWGNCAYQGWLTALLRVEGREPAGEDMAPRVQGIFWHAVLEELVSQLPPGSTQVPPALLDGVLAQVTESLRARGMACHPALWKLAQESARQMVQRLVQTDGLFPFGARPVRDTERAFGTSRSEGAWRTVALPLDPGAPPVHFEGKIDRLDASPDALAVMDYKSGGPRSDSVALDALLQTEFQLPLYLHAARQAGHTGALEAAWISLKTGEVRALSSVLGKAGQTVEGLLATDPAARADAAERGVPNLANAVQALLQPLRQGQFPIRSRDCFGCGLESVCRITSRRLEEAP